MKQFAVLILLLLGGAFGSLLHPFYGILPYYALAVARPQSLWYYALPDGVRWSLMAAAIAMFGVALNASRVLANFRWNPVATLMAIFAGLVLLSCLGARDPDVAGDRAIEYFKIFVMAGIATVTIHHAGHVRWLLLTIFVCIAYVAWEYNARYVFDRRLDILFHGHGGLDNNDAGVLLAMGLPLAYGLWRARRSWLFTGIAAAVALVTVHSLMLSYSRSGMVGALVAVIGIAWLHRPRRQIVVVAPLAIIAILTMAGPEVRNEFLSIRQYDEDVTAQQRLESWARGWQPAWDHPLTGAGVRNSNLMSEAYGSEVNGRSVHNIYLQIGADSGIPAMAVYIAMIITAIVMLRRFRGRLDQVAPPDDDPNHAARHDKPYLPPDRHAELYGMALATEASIVAFAVSGVFLSLEFFELPWLMLVVAGALPTVGDAEIADVAEHARRRRRRRSRSSSRRRSAPTPTPPAGKPFNARPDATRPLFDEGVAP